MCASGWLAAQEHRRVLYSHVSSSPCIVQTSKACPLQKSAKSAVVGFMGSGQGEEVGVVED